MLNKIKILLGISGNSEDELLDLLLDKAKAMMKNYCHAEVSDESIQMDIAIALYNRRGAEGEKSRSEGGVSQAFDNVLSDDIKIQLNAYRVLRW